MSRGQQITYNNPPLAGRPPYATDEPDSIYQTGPSPQARYRQPPPNARTSAYDAYDTYLNDPTNKDERNPFRNPTEYTGYKQSVPLAAPRPGYAAPVAVLSLSRPSPVATPDGRMLDLGTSIPIGVPNTPHPLQPPITPIAPVFARPSVAPSPKDVKFEEQKRLIMRGDKEETLLPKRGEKGDDFWRRFSVVVKEETKTQHKPSNWLVETESGVSRLSRWVWIIAFILILCITGVSVLGWYFTRGSSSPAPPKAVGGKANEPAGPAASTTSHLAGGIVSSGFLHVSPTLTLQDKREPLPSAMPGGVIDLHAYRGHGRIHQRSHLNREGFH